MIHLYRWLVAIAFPARVRRQFGPDMVRMFERQIAATRAGGGSIVRLWLQALLDASFAGTAERLTIAAERARGIGRAVRRWRWWMHALARDLQYAARLLVKQPGVTMIAVVTLALGIGGNTAIFSVVDAVLLRPLPYLEPDRLVRVFEKRPVEGAFEIPVAAADFLDWSAMNRAFDAIAAYSRATVDFTGAGEPVRLVAGAVSPPFFQVLGVAPMLGRAFDSKEATAGYDRVVIIGCKLWEQRFGSDPSVIGRTIALNRLSYEVIGVLPAHFECPDSAVELWIPLALHGTAAPPSRTIHSLDVYARLKPGVSLENARVEMDRVGAILQQDFPDTNRNHGAHVLPLAEHLRQPLRPGLLMLLGAVAFVLLIACVNVANLLLAKAASRRREMAVRAALGAGRARLAGQALTESVLLGLIGGAAGLLVAYWGIDLLRALIPVGLPVLGVQRLGLDARVLAFTFVISLATGAAFGLLPAWQLASDNVNDSLKDGGRSPRGVRRRLRTSLVVAEIALASLLLVGAGLTLRSFHGLLNADAGIATPDVLTAFVSLPNARYNTDEKKLAAFAEIERRLTAIPGVRSVGATSHLPLTEQDSRTGVAIEGRESTPDTPTRAHIRAVTPRYFVTMGIPVRAGRPFTDGDHGESPFVVIVNETMAKRYWADGAPVGKRLRFGGSQIWREIVAVVADVKHWGIEGQVSPELYIPQRQMVWPSLNFVMSSSMPPASLTAAVREQLRAVDPDLPLSNVRTMEQVAARSIASRQSTMILLGVFGLLALVLAAAGIYGVMAHLVAQRTAEIGVRMTLGARPADVLKLILNEGLVQAVAGLTIGLAGAVLLMRGFRSMLYQVNPADPLTLIGVAVLLIVTALAACYVPARRATRVDPVRALRSA